MDSENIYYSPIICYEVSKSDDGYLIDVYLQGHKLSTNTNLHCTLRNFSEDMQTATDFARYLSANCALPVHIPELAEEYLSVNSRLGILAE